MHQKLKEFQLRYPSPIAYCNQPDVDLKLRAAKSKEEGMIVEGYLAVFGVPDDRGTVAVKGCFAKSLQERGVNSKSKYKIVMLWQHKQDEPIGKFLELEEDDYGLRFKVQFDDIPQGERAYKQIRSGTINQFSYGFKYVWDKMEYDETTDKVLMYECALWEGTVCTIGANPETYAIRSAAEHQVAMEQLLEETEDCIKKLPRSMHLEIRQLINKHISLAKFQPEEVDPKTLQQRKSKEPMFTIGSYKLDPKQFLTN